MKPIRVRPGSGVRFEPRHEPGEARGKGAAGVLAIGVALMTGLQDSSSALAHAEELIDLAAAERGAPTATAIG